MIGEVFFITLVFAFFLFLFGFIALIFGIAIFIGKFALKLVWLGLPAMALFFLLLVLLASL